MNTPDYKETPDLTLSNVPKSTKQSQSQYSNKMDFSVIPSPPHINDDTIIKLELDLQKLIIPSFFNTSVIKNSLKRSAPNNDTILYQS